MITVETVMPLSMVIIVRGWGGRVDGGSRHSGGGEGVHGVDQVEKGEECQSIVCIEACGVCWKGMVQPLEWCVEGCPGERMFWG